MTARKLVALLVAVFVAVGLGTVAVLRAGLGETPNLAVSSAPSAPVTFEATAATTSRAPDPNAPPADYLYLQPKKVVLMRGRDVVAAVPRIFDTADSHRNKVVWTNNGDHVALLSGTDLMQKPAAETELITINARSGAVRRLPCPNCQDIAAIGSEDVLASVRAGGLTDEHVTFDLSAGGPAKPVEFPRGDDASRYMLGSTRDRVVTVQYDPRGATSRDSTHRLVMSKVGTVTGKVIGHYGSNAYLPFAAAEDASGPRFAFAARTNAGSCDDSFPIWTMPADGTPSRTDMSAIYPPRTSPGSNSGVDVHDLWWASDGKLRASITSVTCATEQHGGTRSVVRKRATLWKLDGTKWVEDGVSAADMVRELPGGEKIVLVAPDCTGDITDPEPSVYCNTGRLYRESNGSRDVVAEQVLWIATRPMSVPAQTTSAAPPPTASAPAIDSFVGTWTQHAGGLVVKADGLVHMTYQTTAVPVSFPKVTLKITEAAGGKATAVVLTSDDSGVPMGSSVTLELKAPGIVTTSAAGQSRWCDTERRAQGECGA